MTALERHLSEYIHATLTDFTPRLTLLCARRRRLIGSDHDPLLNDLEHLRAAAEQIIQRHHLDAQKRNDD